MKNFVVFTCKYMKNFVDSILTFIVNGIFGGSHPGFFLKIVIRFRYA